MNEHTLEILFRDEGRTIRLTGSPLSLTFTLLVFAESHELRVMDCHTGKSLLVEREPACVELNTFFYGD